MNQDCIFLLLLGPAAGSRFGYPSAATTRVIDIQSKPPQPPPHHNRAAAVSFKPQPQDGDGGEQQHNSHRRIHVEDRFTDYIGRVRRKLRTPSTVGGGGDNNRYNYDKRNSGIGNDNKFSDYISHVKNKFVRTSNYFASCFCCQAQVMDQVIDLGTYCFKHA
ncbi:unnamed protein product [Linum tenue]|uniref:Uncharacterized protein n=1 Tax=Linum tenue TaxID=586396 RepID=A0AAV0HW41_9ROSI|nr:unnamed protein product [Linum tenue]